jgi:hypothetical protein
MGLEYKAVFRLAEGTNAVQLAEQEMQAWIESRKGLTPTAREELRAGKALRPGIHSLSKRSSLIVAEVSRVEDLSQRKLIRFTEENNTGTWCVSVHAFSLPNGGSGKRQTLLVDVDQVDGPPTSGVVAPPRFVTQLLGREHVYDGRTPLLAEPRMVRHRDVDELVQAIVDPTRSASVIAAASLEPRLDEPLRKRLKSLTSGLTGLAATYVVTDEAFEAFERALPASHRIQRGRVRTFLPGVKLGDGVDARRHRILGPATFARAIHGNAISFSLREAFAIETRAPLLAAPLPPDVRRGVEVLQKSLAEVTREASVERRITEFRETRPTTKVQPPTLENIGVPFIARLQQTLARWLGTSEVPQIQHLEQLDELVERQQALADALFEEAASMEGALQGERASLALIRELNDDLELSLAESEDETRRLQYEVQVLRNRLVVIGQAEETFVEPEDEEWAAPESLTELVERLSLGKNSHKASDFVVFTGSIDPIKEILIRDPVGRYARAFWDYVHVLYDFAVARRSGFAGNVHSYLNDDKTPGKKCSPNRHATHESESTLQQWGHERVFPVPTSIHLSGEIQMPAHFKPTHENTFAPRMHYYDDTSASGKMYVGYIGKHLTNKQSRNS